LSYCSGSTCSGLELSSWAMLVVSFGGLGFESYRASLKSAAVSA
jgi:hypothetical protein